MGATGWVRALWLRIQEPRVVTTTQAAIYLVCIIAGAVSLLAPPTPLVAVFTHDAGRSWGALMLSGGLLGLPSCLSGVWWVERAGIVALASAAAMYLVASVSLELADPDTSVAGVIAMTLIALLGLAQRWADIHRWTHDPERS